jgi:hypothetical protein
MGLAEQLIPGQRRLQPDFDGWLPSRQNVQGEIHDEPLA